MNKHIARKTVCVICFMVVFLVQGCFVEQFRPLEVHIFKYHAGECIKNLELFAVRLYAKNPKYEPDLVRRQKRIKQIFHDQANYEGSAKMSSHLLLSEAFAEKPLDDDRVYLLGLGLVKSIKEVYGIGDNTIMISGLQVPLERLQRLHHNLSQVNWRLKTYKDEKSVIYR